MSTRAHIHTLRLISAVEGLSWLLLLGAMFYRAKSGHHEPVSIMGSIHGALFCVFALSLLLTWLSAKWKISFCFLIGILSLIPTGFLLAEHFLKKKLKEQPR